jgi:CRISPR-associated protein Cmr4
LPVRSLYGTFAWLSCPLALWRWQRDHEAAGLAAPPLPSTFRFALPAAPVGAPAHRPAVAMLVWPGHNIQIATPFGQEWAVYLEDLDLLLRPDEAVRDIAETIAEAVFDTTPWATMFKQRFGIVPDDVFNFLATTGMEVVARIKLRDESKTVENLWYEEAVPAETIHAGPILAPRGTPARQGEHPAPAYSDEELLALLEAQQDRVIQVGGGASVGRGLVRVRLHGGM